jgi:hypothetical protein
MPPLAWLLLAVAAGVAAGFIGLPAWRSYRSREQRDLNAERYRAWRGHGGRGAGPSMREGMTADERRRVAAGAGLAALAAIALVAFFLTS